MRKFIPVAEPSLEGNELKYLTDCIESGWISSVGKYVGMFEKEFAEYIGCKYGIAVHTGTAALHLALLALRIGPGDEVIIPTLTFAATANAVLYTGAKPVLVDVEEETWNLDPDLFEKKVSGNTKAIIPVHLYGHPCDMDEITKIAEKYNIAIIEDAAEAHGAEYKGKKVGSFGTISIFSFFGNKIITTGEGGMCVTDDPTLVERIEKIRDHGMRKDKKYWHDEVGFNYRMTNLQAAVGLAQFEKINTFLTRKREIADLYNSYLSEVDGLILPIEKPWAKNVFWMYSIVMKKDHYSNSRDDLIEELKKKGIDSRPIFYPLHKMPPYSQDAVFPNAESISDFGISLPSGVTLTDEEIKYICEVVKKYLTS
jgi:perosamine synthetase